MYQFSYQKASNLADAIHAMKSGAQALSGGQSLLPTMKARLANPEKLVDLSQLSELATIKKEGNKIIIGATATHDAVAHSKLVQENIPALAHLAGMIGDIHVRNLGTIGGSLANNDPAACYPSALLALNGIVHTSNGRMIQADDFFNGIFTTNLASDEIITAVEFAKPLHANYQKFVQPASRFALVGVFVAKTATGVRVAITGAGQGGVFRVHSFEDALNKNYSQDALDGLFVPAKDCVSDIHGTAEYRAHLINILTRRAVLGS